MAALTSYTSVTYYLNEYQPLEVEGYVDEAGDIRNRTVSLNGREVSPRFLNLLTSRDWDAIADKMIESEY